MHSSMKPVICLALVLTACAKTEKAPDTTAAAAPAAAPAPEPPKTAALADFAGTWNTVAKPVEGTDTASTKSTLTATADTTGWMLTLGGQKVKVHPRVDGDSVITTSEPYKSVRRKGLMVTTVSVMRKQGDKLVGTTTAHYVTKSADSVLHLTTESTKAP